MTRRNLLNLMLGSAGVHRFSAMNAFAQGDDYKALVCIFLFGGNDSDNTVVPVSSQYDTYRSVRGELAIPREELLPMPAASLEMGLHPAMGAIHPLYAESKLAVVANVGLLVRPLTRESFNEGDVPRPRSLFSHSDQQRQWQTAPPNNLAGTGWAGRVADRWIAANGIPSFPTNISLSGSSAQLVGIQEQPATLQPNGTGVLNGSDDSPAAQARDAAVQEMLEFDSGFVMVQAASQILRDAIDVGRIIDEAIGDSAPLSTEFPATRLGNQLLQVARIIRARGALGARRQIFFCATGGYDTHSNQLGRHVGLLTNLAQSMQAFHQATGELGVENQVTTCTESEFARTFVPNGRAGTDHAWGGHQMVLGGAVRGGALYGRFPNLTPGGPDDTDQRGRWIPTTALDQYAATLSKWFGLNDADVDAVFPNLGSFASRDLGFMAGA